MDYANLVSLLLDNCSLDLDYSGWTFDNDIGFEERLRYETTVRSPQQFIVYVKAQ